MPRLTKEQIAITVIENADPKDWGFIAGQLVGASMAYTLGQKIHQIVARIKTSEKGN
ncbi:hypothetical protein RAP15_41 [Arthrobacter phage RAP15]|uniref:Uncharacterized protein n=6 Tax=Korravirus TaxID=1982076 RepID=A0A2H4P9K8_9CAUD|nr:hypothetical protein RAP15_41 [Arthrobacter phage RAP15]ASR83486.1 hypothetical protein SEA_DINO_41 [Arthrobacter phage Dino]ATW58912.1 hypothetical protein PHIRE_FLUKE_41 [Arthrobacter phage Fluke]ATW58972.1 hypothetical protein PHIRE_MEGANNOLL_40 [Arthrobacter phage MeganNoll]AZS11489.1 hypothetical protein SEA_ZORRO_41 [Arthrobacter phage Zorro]QCG76988.1 hypothetical protein SEA_SCUTTLE_40 [Arthrobacter phage Scuttle]